MRPVRTGRHARALHGPIVAVLMWSGKFIAWTSQHWCCNEAHQQLPQEWISHWCARTPSSTGFNFFHNSLFFKEKNNTVIIQIQPPFISLQESSLPDRGAIPNGGLWFLKGAARIQTAMAVVVAFDSMSQEARVIKDYINVRVMILLGQFQWLSILFVKILIPWPWRFQCCSSPPFEQSSANTSGFPIDKRSCSMVGDWTIMFIFKFVELFVGHESSNKCDWLSMFYLVFWRTNE